MYKRQVIKVIAGPEKHSRVVPEAERRLTAYHEAGHAVVMQALPDLDPVHQITIVPRGQAGGMTIIKDCYNAGPESMAAALAVLGKKQGRRIAVLGDMLELGDCTQAEHYRVGRIAAEKADFVFAYGPNSGRIISGTITGGMPETRGRAFTNREELVAALKRTAKPGDVLLFKASHGIHLEQVIDAFLGEEK